nr:hypothetical protein [Tanacetum cinerariifolium]
MKHKARSKSKKKKKSKISDDENNMNSKIRTRTTPTALFNAMAILNGDRKKCLHEMGFGSMIEMGIHKLPRKLDFCNRDLARNEDAEDANVVNPSEVANVAQASPTAQDVNKLSADRHSAEEEQNTEDFESVKTPPVKKHGRPKKIVRANENKSSSVKRRGRPRKSNDESKKQTIGSKRKGREYKNSKIHSRTTPTTLFNAMAILNGDRKKCLHEMGFGSMIGMGIHELPGKLGFYDMDNLDAETNVLSLTDNSILVTSQSDKNDLLDSDSKMESDSLASVDDNQKSNDDDGKQDVVMDKIDEQNKEDVCKEDVNEPIAKKINYEDQDAEETPFEFADTKDE